jgi:prepilin-type processing-associated H-X9-DG protein
MNSYVGFDPFRDPEAFRPPPISGARMFLKLDDLAFHVPSELFVVIDVHEDFITEAVFLSPQASTNPGRPSWAELSASRHGGVAVLSFADGHVESHKWVEASTRQPVVRLHRYGDAPDGDYRDVRWLWQRSTSLKQF